jgi:hypothetical protein
MTGLGRSFLASRRRGRDVKGKILFKDKILRKNKKGVY